jgi:hypothetical protein
VLGPSGTSCATSNASSGFLYGITSSTIQCAIGGPRVAGFYNMSFTTRNEGTAEVAKSTRLLSPLDESYMLQQVAGNA